MGNTVDRGAWQATVHGVSRVGPDLATNPPPAPPASGKVKVKQLSRVRLCDPVDRSPPGSSVRGILQARILQWVAISFSRGSSRPRDGTQVFHIGGRRFNL